MKKVIGTFIILTTISLNIMAQQKIVQTAGRTQLGEFAPEFAHLNDDILFGEVWSRNDLLSLRDRSLVTITSLISQGITDSSLKYHLQSAKNNGISRTEAAEIITHLAFEIPGENTSNEWLEAVSDEECIRLTDRFLPFVDNWAVYDIMSPKVFAKHKKELLAKIKIWSKSSYVYTCRFGTETLMSHYLDKDFKAEHLDIPASVRSEEYREQPALPLCWFKPLPFIKIN